MNKAILGISMKELIVFKIFLIMKFKCGKSPSLLLLALIFLIISEAISYDYSYPILDCSFINQLEESFYTFVLRLISFFHFQFYFSIITLF